MARLTALVLSALLGLLAALSFPGGAEAASKRIVVSIAEQRLYAYDGGQLVISAPVTTGRPEMPTPRGTFAVRRKSSPHLFTSPFPVGHPFYYAPVSSTYALQFLPLYYLHDAPWRASFGPGTNTWHVDDWGRRRTGSLGCVNVPTGPMARLFHWASIGTPVIIQ